MILIKQFFKIKIHQKTTKFILNIIVNKDFSLEQGLFWPRDLIMYKYKIFSLILHDTGLAEW